MTYVTDANQTQLTLELDHIVVAAPTLSAGIAWAKHTLGKRMAGGGAHPNVATHNRLLNLGDCYLEVLARNPDDTPTRPRWFGLDDAIWAEDAPTQPRVVTWVLRTNDLDAALQLPGARGVARDASRGSLRWRIGVPDDGALPADGAFPTFIEWPDGIGPVRNMPESGCALTSLTIRHREADTIAHVLRPHLADPRITFETGASQIAATVLTDQGPRFL